MVFNGLFKSRVVVGDKQMAPMSCPARIWTLVNRWAVEFCDLLGTLYTPVSKTPPVSPYFISSISFLNEPLPLQCFDYWRI